VFRRDEDRRRHPDWLGHSCSVGLRLKAGIGAASVGWVTRVACLRDVVESDLDAFYEQQLDPEATRMALFPARDRESFDSHWARVLADDAVTKKTIVHDGNVAGNVLCWEMDGRRLVGYWLGREFWGKGLATKALRELTGEVTARPLHAWVATSNVPSIRVLEKCGFVAVRSRTEVDEKLGQPVEELLLELA
jgi:RimJ/RimL family protein N-acetyltransferase